MFGSLSPRRSEGCSAGSQIRTGHENHKVKAAVLLEDPVWRGQEGAESALRGYVQWRSQSRRFLTLEYILRLVHTLAKLSVHKFMGSAGSVYGSDDDLFIDIVHYVDTAI